MKKRAKKGIEPLVATVLIIGFTIVLAALVMKWTGTFFTTTTTRTSEASDVAITCTSDIQFSVEDACIEGNTIKLLLQNKGTQPIESFVFQVTGKEAQTTNSLTGLSIYASNFFLANYTSIPYASLPNEIQRVKIYPKILVQGNEEVCTEISYVPANLKTCVDEDTIAYYSFNNNINDESGNENNGTIHNAVYVEGVLGNGLQFDGTTASYVDIGDVPDLDQAFDKLTLSAWIYSLDNTTNGAKSIIVKSEAGGPGTGYNFFINYPSGGYLTAEFRGGTSIRSVARSSIISQNKWHYVVAVKDGGNLFLYVDGQRVASSLGGYFVIIPNDKPFRIGAGQSHIFDAINGIIDEVMISKVARP